MNIKGIIKDTIIITLITVVAGFSLGFANNATKDVIKAQMQSEKMNALKSVFEEAQDFNILFDTSEEMSGEASELKEKYEKAISDAGYTCTMTLLGEALDANSSKIGYVMNIMSTEGYGSEIVLSVGIDNEGTIKGTYILAINETPGLGMNAKNPEFISQFADKKVDKFQYAKVSPADLTGDNQIAAISGATITTNAIVNSVNSALAVYSAVGGE